MPSRPRNWPDWRSCAPLSPNTPTTAPRTGGTSSPQSSTLPERLPSGSSADRRIEIHWPNPLPIDEGEQLRNAQIKAQLGLPSERILAELGYDRGAGANS